VKIPYDWLKEFVVTDMEPDELARRLTMRGLEVESVEKTEASFDGVMVGEVMEVSRHPNAEDLLTCRVSIGDGTLPIVCGAKNIKKGDRVPVAVPGSKLPGGPEIEKRVIRGAESTGMLCSERELGLSDDHTGIFILPGNMNPGDQLRDAGWIKDFVLDLNVPPNRGDCLSIFGIAREVGSILNQKAKPPLFNLHPEPAEHIEDYVALEILDTEGCPRYVLRMLKDIVITSSPYWMRSRLIKCGMRPINTIVDVTNYVMLELGQPLHAFDYDMLRNRKVQVRLSGSNSPFRTLDGVDRALVAGDILICDGEGPVGIAGIMGGENSEIRATTRHVALESAYFNPLFIRKTARRLGIKSEASLRFEKGIDFDNVDFAAERAVFLMNRLSGGIVVSGKKEVLEKKEPKTIFISYAKINGFLGTYIEPKDITGALRSIDLHVIKEQEDGLLVSVPQFRYDLEEYTDIIEEVARIYGYEHIPATTPASVLQVQKKEQKGLYHRTAKEYLRSAGFSEVINFAFFSRKDIENFLLPQSDERVSCVPILNPISRDYEVMRTFVTAGILKTIAFNLNRGVKNVRIFETGKTFTMKGEEPSEQLALAFAMVGKEREYFWRETTPECDFFDAKGILEGLVARFDIDFSVDRSTEPFLNTNRSADIFIRGTKAGWIGEIESQVLKSYEIDQKICCAELKFDIILNVGNLELTYTQIPRFPQSTRDFSFIIDDRIPVSTLVERINKVSPLITSVGVFDMFRKDVRSVAFRVVFQSFEETLRDETVNRLQEEIIGEVTSVEGVRLRT
jgi:phenylalanyl-tRNA synthetase beta chain